MKGNNSILLRRSFFPRYALGMPSFNNNVFRVVQVKRHFLGFTFILKWLPNLVVSVKAVISYGHLGNLNQGWCTYFPTYDWMPYITIRPFAQAFRLDFITTFTQQKLQWRPSIAQVSIYKHNSNAVFNTPYMTDSALVSLVKMEYGWKEYFPKLLESTLLVKIFVFWDRDLKFWLQLRFFEIVKMVGLDLT